MQALGPPQRAALQQQLAEALEVLEEQADAQAKLLAIQKACTSLVELVEGGGRLPTDLLENALEAVARGLGAARQRIEAEAGQLAALRTAAADAGTPGAWATALLAAADTCMHSVAWHAAWHAGAAGGDSEPYRRTVAVARDLLKNELVPLLCEAAAQQTSDTGFCLAPQFQALLAMGRTAAEIVGMRDERYRRPSLRNFSVLNVVWNGVQQAWTAVAPEVRPDMEQQGVGAAAVVGALLGFVRKDVAACHTLLDPGVGKLLLYWLNKACNVAASYPTAVLDCWDAALEVPVCIHREVALLEALAPGSGGGSAARLAEALQAQVLPKVMGLLGKCLSTVAAEDQLRVMLDGLRMRLAAGEQPGQVVAALRVALHLLQSSPGLQLLARHHAVSLLDSVLGALPGPACAAALQSAELREQVADAALTFLATCCHTAATAAGNEALQAWERQLAAQTWERCQQQLFHHALQPHPLTAHVLGCVWSDLAAAASEPLLKSHIATLRHLLHTAAAAEAAGGHGPPSPLYQQLLGLLACLLAAAPPATLQAYFANFLKVLPSMRNDACQLACLSAELRLAALADGACGGCAAAPAVQEVLHSLFALLSEAAPPVVKQANSAGAGGPAAAAPDSSGAAAAQDAAALYLTWLLDATQCAVAYMSSTGAAQGAGDALLPTLVSRIVTLLVVTVGCGVLAFAAPSLALLRAAQALVPPSPAELEGLVPVLAACLQRPDLAALVAELAPALAHCPGPHAEVMHAVVGAAPPPLQHLGLEAFYRYAKACPPANIMAALPPAMRHPETGAALESVQPLLVQYTQRCPAGAPQPDEEEMAGWAATLRHEALGATAALRRAVEALRAEAEVGGTASGSPEMQDSDSAGQEQDSLGEGSLAAALQQVAAGIDAAEAALRAAPLDAGAAHLLQQCAARLSQLLGAGGVGDGV